jgi:hypothetical protein
MIVISVPLNGSHPSTAVTALMPKTEDKITDPQAVHPTPSKLNIVPRVLAPILFCNCARFRMYNTSKDTCIPIRKDTSMVVICENLVKFVSNAPRDITNVQNFSENEK